MFKLKVSEERAIKELKTIPHGTCKKGIETRWYSEDGYVAYQSVCWLFCWAETGQGSQVVSVKAKEVFDKLFSITYKEFRKKIGHSKALDDRYRMGMAGHELARIEEIFGL